MTSPSTGFAVLEVSEKGHESGIRKLSPSETSVFTTACVVKRPAHASLKTGSKQRGTFLRTCSSSSSSEMVSVSAVRFGSEFVFEGEVRSRVAT